MRPNTQYTSSDRLQCHYLCIIASLIFALSLSWAAEADEAHGEASHDFHRHHAAFIVGVTEGEDSKSGFSLGVDYEYRFSELFGLGGVVEYTGGDFDHVLLLVPVFIHPYKGWLLNVAAGAEIHEEHEEHGVHVEHEEDGDNERTADWVARVGAAYQFHFGERYTIAPEVNVDFTEHETAFAYGVAFGVGF